MIKFIGGFLNHTKRSDRTVHDDDTTASLLPRFHVAVMSNRRTRTSKKIRAKTEVFPHHHTETSSTADAYFFPAHKTAEVRTGCSCFLQGYRGAFKEKTALRDTHILQTCFMASLQVIWSNFNFSISVFAPCSEEDKHLQQAIRKDEINIRERRGDGPGNGRGTCRREPNAKTTASKVKPDEIFFCLRFSCGQGTHCCIRPKSPRHEQVYREA